VIKKVESAVENFSGAAKFIYDDMYKFCIRVTQFAGTPVFQDAESLYYYLYKLYMICMTIHC
jgi:hypothetical protein